MRHDIIVLKFGSSVLQTRVDLPAAVHEIYRWYRAGWRVVAVLSAIGGTTEQLLRQAYELTDHPEPHATAELLATGERQSAALLALALDRAGVPSRLVDPRAVGLSTEDAPLDSEPVGVISELLATLVAEFAVLVVPGCFGISAKGELQLFGLGGSDLAAVYIASALKANRCRLVKDVDGVYEFDPTAAREAGDPPPRRFAALNYKQALECAARLIQPTAVQFLDRASMSAEVAALASPFESTIGSIEAALGDPLRTSPLSVVLLGVGTVGFGVYQRLRALPEHFSLVGALVRDRTKHAGIPEALLYESLEVLSALHADVVIDALPGLEPSHDILRQCLERGIHVVTANKALVAAAGPDLAAFAARHGASFAYSAAVGGSAPFIETVRREAWHGEIRCLAGVLSGACNYIIERCSEGTHFKEAVREAHEHGFAEAEAAEDLAGQDAVHKLRILARHAFGQDLTGIAVEPLNAAVFLRRRATLREGERLRVIARAWKLGTRVLGQVRPEAVTKDDPLAPVRGEWNRLIVTRADGTEVIVSGRGAGRWPATEAVMADLLDLARMRRRNACKRSQAPSVA